MSKLIYYLEKFQLIMGTIFLVVFVLTSLIQVITRYIGISATWTEEVSVNSFIWAMFLGAAVMVKYKQHFSFNLFDNKLSPLKRIMLSIFQDIVIFTFCIACFIYSTEITNTFWNSRWITIPFFKQGYVWLILPITFLTISIYLIDDVLKQVNDIKKYK